MSRRRRRAQARRHVGARRRQTRVAAAVTTLGAVALLLGVTVNSAIDNLEHLDELRPVPLGQNTRVYDKNGTLLGRVAGITNRTEVRWDDIAPELRDATVAIEDKRFWSHSGVDYYRVLGAAVKDLTSGAATQGGSTITMQLVKNLYDPKAARTISQKIEEAYLAYRLEQRLSKQEILRQYLNGVFYGSNAIGVEAASLTFFNRSAKNVTLTQAALLAGLPQAPSAYNPFAYPERARERRNVVLEEMADQGYISRERVDQAKRAGLGLKRGRAYRTPRERYFFDYVRQELIGKYGLEAVQKGGFKVYTTIDRRLQRAAEQAISDNLGLPGDPVAAIVLIDSRNGFIRAMASSQPGGPGNQFNYAAQARRQAGSAFKTFVLTEAVKQGINPYTTLYESKKLDFDDPDYGPIEVSTYSNTYRGVIPVASATLSSDNSVYTQLTMDVDPGKVVDTAYAMGIPKVRNLPRYPSVGLGSGNVTPLDMAVAYAPLSNGGIRVGATPFLRIERPNGRTEDIAPVRKRVFPDGVAYEVTRILRDNVRAGTGGRAALSVPVAGKTGTTDDFVDAWFVGYTPHLSAAVWVGYPNDKGEKRSLYNVHGVGAVAGGTIPAQIWHDFMEIATEREGYVDFELPENPVSWSPFSSDFTRAAAEARKREIESGASVASEKARSEREARRTETEGEGATGPDLAPDPLLPPEQVPTAPGDPAVSPPPAAPVAPPPAAPPAPPATPPGGGGPSGGAPGPG
jgi:penicillin-binding protein 1A